MTDTDFPSSPVVDENRNLTSEWLNFMADIEKLDQLKTLYTKEGNTNVSALLKALETVEAAFDIAKNRSVPGNIIFSLIPETVAPATLVPHGLGTDMYIPMVRALSGAVIIMAPIFNGNMTQKDATAWGASFAAAWSDKKWFTFTIEGA